MKIFDTIFRPEKIDPTAFLASGAIVRGNVTMGARSSAWFYAVIRGDTESITIGDDTNLQDACILHADAGYPCILGNRVTVGHAAIVHGAIVEDDVMIGMRAVVLNGVKIGSGSIIGAGAVLPERMVVPPYSLVLGVPGRVVRATTEEDRQRLRYTADHYVSAAEAYRTNASS